MARILIVGGGRPGRELARRMVERGHAVRITTRREEGRAAIEAAGAECWIGTPDRLATLRGALDGVTIGCWLLAHARGEAVQVSALHSSRLEFFLSQAIDTTARGLIYDAGPGRVPAELLDAGARRFAAITELNAIPAVVLRGAGESSGGGEATSAGCGEARPDEASWLARAEDAIGSLLGA